VGDSAPISVYFTSDVLGPFSEVFEVRMKGCTAVLRVHFKGMVVPPAFTVDSRILEFGEVPFDFPQIRKICLTNASDVPFPFSFRIPADGKSDSKRKKEFTVVPWKGLLAPDEAAEITIEFTSNTAKKYDGYEVVMDVDRVGDALLRVPIVATCVVPSVSLVQDSVDFESCFVRHPYTRFLSLRNKDKHPARYHLIPQDEHSQVIALYSPSSMQGVVPATGCVEVEIQLTCYKVGPIVLPIFVSVAGSSSDSLKVRTDPRSFGIPH
jgi:hydrocephalus-inducing protein